MKLSKFIQISSCDINKKFDRNENPLKRKSYNNRRKYLDTKEKIMDILQYYYHGSKIDRDRIAKICGYESFENISKRLSSKRKLFNIQPSEIGFIQMPTKIDKRSVKIKNWVIKSHSGIFDEKDEVEEDGTDNTN